MNSYLVSFATPRQKRNNLFELIASLYVLDRSNIDYQEIAQNLTTLRLKKKYTLYIIDPDIDSEQDNLYIPTEANTLDVWLLRPETFFNREQIQLFINKEWEKETYIIFIFKNTKWKNIVYNFNLLNIIVSGGTKSKRQLSTGLNGKLNLFTWAIEVGNTIEELDRSYYTTSPFHLEKDHTQPIHDFTSKEIRTKISDHLESIGETLPKELPVDKTEEIRNALLKSSLEKSKNTESSVYANTQSRKFHTSSNLKSIKLSDRIPASVYKTNNFTPLSEQTRFFNCSQYLLNNINNLNNLNNLNNSYMDLLSYRNNNNPLASFINNYINNPLYNQIRVILDNIELSNSQKQFRVEEGLTDFWRKEIVSLFRDNQKLFRSEYGIKMVYNSIVKLDRDLQDWKDDNRSLRNKKYKSLLKLMSNPDIVSIVLCNIIPFCIKYDSVLNQDVISLFEKVGKEIEKVFYRNEWFKYKNRNKKDWNDKNNTILNNYYIVDIKNYEIKITDILENIGIVFEDKLSENDFIDKLRSVIGGLTEDDYLKLGLDLIEFISTKSSLYTVENKRVDKETLKRYILPGSNLKTHILDIITYDSDLIPMINKPGDWVIVKGKKEGQFYIKKYGGFISNKNNKKHYLKKSHKNIGPSKLHNLDIINTINYLSSIKYCINIDLLKIIFELLDKQDDRINKLIKINLHPKTKDIFDLSYDKDKQIELYEILKYNSQYYRDRTVLHLALLFSKWCSNNNNSVYFPLFVDWRGRILTNTGSFSYQQGELARSLILFRDGQILNKSGVESLKIYTANCFGKDKLTYNNRLVWVDENIDNIINLNLDFIFEADEPFLFLSCCLELKGYFNNPINFISRLPIYKDATCNG
jgi:hypothetical protein